MSYIEYYVDPETARGAAAGTRERQIPSSQIPYFQIGKENSRINNPDAIRAIQNESIPGINSFSSSLEQRRRNANRSRLNREYYQRYMAFTKEALCACANTNNSEIASAAHREAAEINAAGINMDISSCGSALVSKNEYFSSLLRKIMIPRASANTRAKNVSSSSMVLQFAEEPLGITPANQNFKVCTLNHSFIIDSNSGLLLARNKSCNKRERLSKTVSFKKSRGHLSEQGILMISFE